METGVEAQEGIQVAIAANELLMRECLAEVLARGGLWTAASVPDSASLLEFMEGHRPHVVIVESREALLALRQRHPEARALVLCDGRAPEQVEELLREGAWGYIDKALAGTGEVMDAIRAIARGERGVVLCTRPPEQANGSGLGSSPLDGLTPREREVLGYVAAGANNLEISGHLGISERTVKAHVSNLYRKLGQENRTQLAILARRLGIRPPVHA